VSEPVMVECLLAQGDRDVTSPSHARRIVGELLGVGRAVEPVVGARGVYLVEFTPAELAELRANRYFTRTAGDRELTAEYPDV